MGRITKGKGTRFGHVLTFDQREEIVRRYVSGEEKTSLAEEFGITPTAVNSYLRVRSIPLRVKPIIPRPAVRPRPPGPVSDIPETDLAYLAGFIDGEGSIGVKSTSGSLRSRRSYITFVVCSNTDEAIIRWMHSLLRGTFRMESRDGMSNAQPIFRWQTTGPRAAEVLRLLLPYLRVKHDQAILTLEYQDHLIAYGGHKHNPVTDEEIAWRIERRNFISSLNTRCGNRSNR